MKHLAIMIAALLSVVLQPVLAQDIPERRYWEGYMVMPEVTSDYPQWAHALYRDGRFYTLWINELVSGYADGAVSEQEFLQVMWEGIPERMDGFAELNVEGDLNHVSRWLMLNLVSMQSMGIQDIVEGEPIFFDPRRLQDEDGMVIPGEERAHQAAIHANAILKEVLLLARHGGFGEGERSEWFEGHSAPSCKRVRLAIPAQVMPEDVQAWADMMRLSDAQRAHFLRLHEAYAAADDALRELLIAPMIEQFEQLKPRLHRASSDVDVAEPIRALQQRISAAVRQIVEAERAALFDEMESVLTDAQLANLKVVRDRRMRDVYKVVGSCLDGAAIDLSALFAEVIDDGLMATYIDKDKFLNTLTTYEGELTELHRRHHDAKRELMMRGPLLKVRQSAAAEPQRLQAQYDGLLDRVLAAEQAIIDLHEMHLSLLVQHLTSDAATILRDAYNEHAYPQVYPNPYDMSEVIANVLAFDDLTEKQRSDVVAIHDAAKQQQQAICGRMSHAVLEWTVLLLRRFTIDMEVRFAHSDKLDAWHAERRSVAELGIESLYGIVGETHAAELSALIETFRGDAARFLPRDTGMHYYPAAPPGDLAKRH